MEIKSIEKIDFNELWKKAARNLPPRILKKDIPEFWNEQKAKKFNENIKKNNYEKGNKQIKDLKRDLNSTVLEIGPGPGTLTIPLAKRVGHVTVIEPSQGMIKYLMKNTAEEGLDNITCINKRWEDIGTNEIKNHDVVVASFSLSMLNMRDALEKMNELANKYVYIFGFMDRSPWELFYGDLYQKLHNKPLSPGPKSIYIYNILHQMGIYANVAVKEEIHTQKFSDFNDAFGHLKNMLDIETEKQEKILRDYLSNMENLTLNGKSTTAMIWWEKKKH